VALFASRAAASAISRWVCRLCSRSWSNAPQRVRSDGIGFASTHFALTKPLKSPQGLIFASRSLTSKDGAVVAAIAVVDSAAKIADARVLFSSLRISFSGIRGLGLAGVWDASGWGPRQVKATHENSGRRP